MAMDIDLNLFQVFVEVADSKSITRASEKLYLTQPAVTQSINRLEEALGVKLLIRQNKGVQLTDYGKLIYNDVNDSIKQIKSAISNLQKLTNVENAVLKIGCGANIAKWVINKPCKQLVSAHPNIRIELFDLKINELIEQLQNGEIDCFISYGGLNMNSNITNFKVKSTTYCFVGGKKFKYLSKQKNDVSILNNLPFVASRGKPSNTGNYFNQICEEYGLNINFKIEASRFGTILEFVRDNIGIAFIPEYVANEVCDNESLFRIEVDIPLKEVDFYVYYNKHYQSKLLLELLEKIK